MASSGICPMREGLEESQQSRQRGLEGHFQLVSFVEGKSGKPGRVLQQTRKEAAQRVTRGTARVKVSDREK